MSEWKDLKYRDLVVVLKDRKLGDTFMISENMLRNVINWSRNTMTKVILSAHVIDVNFGIQFRVEIGDKF